MINIAVVSPRYWFPPDVLHKWALTQTGKANRYVLALCDGSPGMESGCFVCPVELDTLRRQKVRQLLGWLSTRTNPLAVQLRDAVLRWHWSEIVWTLKSFDPDVIDLTLLSKPDRIRAWIQSELPRVVVADSGASGASLRIDPARRKYDPRQKVSIVLPVFNGADFLAQSLESCVRQTHSNLEIIVVDDGSRDATPHIIAQFQAADPRVHVIRHPLNRGLPAALNTGFSQATGEWITWTSHDNYYALTAIQRMMEYLNTWSEADMVYGLAKLVNDKGEITGSMELRPVWDLRYHNYVGACFLLRRDVWEKLGPYREDLQGVEDYEYWLRMCARGFTVLRLCEYLYFYRQHAGSLTQRIPDRIQRMGVKVRKEHRVRRFTC